MSWHKVSDNVYERPIGGNEKFMTLLTEPGAALGREQWSISSTASFHYKGDPSHGALADKFRSAWKLLRFQHPSIASFEEGDKLVYTVPDERSLEEWCEATFIIASLSDSVEDIVASLKPTPMMTLHYVPRHSQVLLHSSHWRMDGIGILMLLNAFFEAAATVESRTNPQLSWGDEVKRLAPAVEEALSMPTTITAEMKATADEYTATFGHYADCAGIRIKNDSKAVPGGTRAVQLQLSQAMTTKVVEAAKALRIGVTSAIHAAVAVANQKLATPHDQKKHFASTIRFSYRPYLPAAYNSPSPAAGLYTTGYISKLPPAASWAANAGYVDAEYKKGLTPDFIKSYRQYGINLQNFLKNMLADAPPLSNIDISNLGLLEHVLERHYGTDAEGIEVTNVTVGVETLTPQVVVFVWTFRDRLSLYPVYNEAFFDREDALLVAETVKEALLDGLASQSW